MSVYWLQRLAVSVLCTLFLPSALSQNHTSTTAVQGLLAFKAKTRDPQSLLASWNSSSMPCSTADCNSNKIAQDCNWAGIACQNGQVVALAVSCTVQSNGATGACALQGAPLDSLAQVTSLKLLDLSGNALQGTLPAAFGTALQSLSVLLLGSNSLTGTLPAAWSSLTSLTVADLGDNNLNGFLPSSWSAWSNMRGLRLTSNSLTGSLPATYGSWAGIQELELGGNALYGTVPSIWASMAALQDLELDYNCGLCGSLPSFPMQASGQLSVDTSHSSIGSSCGGSNCSSSNLGLILRTVIAVAVIVFVLALITLRSWQLRRRRRLGYLVQNTWEFRLRNQIRRCFGMQPVIAPVSSFQHVHRRSRDAEVGGGHRRRRTKQEQPTLVIMPDGTGLCFAVRDSPTTEPNVSGSQDLPSQVIYTNPLADCDSSEAAATSHAQLLSDAHIFPSESVMAGVPRAGSTEPGDGAALPGNVPQHNS
ncbi:hypothetical protein WJX77_010085 [Trebouxia sp. C0004]